MLSAASPTDRPFALSIDVSHATLGSPTDERPGSSCDGHAPLDGPSSRDTVCAGAWKSFAWKGNEDARLAALVASCAAEGGKVRWSVVGAQMQGRSGKQCRERWHNHLSPDVCKNEWTAEEDAAIVAKVQPSSARVGREIGKLFPGRTDNSSDQEPLELDAPQGRAQAHQGRRRRRRRRRRRSSGTPASAAVAAAAAAAEVAAQAAAAAAAAAGAPSRGNDGGAAAAAAVAMAEAAGSADVARKAAAGRRRLRRRRHAGRAHADHAAPKRQRRPAAGAAAAAGAVCAGDSDAADVLIATARPRGGRATALPGRKGDRAYNRRKSLAL